MHAFLRSKPAMCKILRCRGSAGLVGRGGVAYFMMHDPRYRTHTGRDPGGGALTRGNLSLDELRHKCTWKGEDVPLTVTEFLLVKTLAQRPGLVKSRDQLIDAAYGDTVYVDDRTIDSHIKRVRKKFRQVDDDFNQIETLYGIGYRYKED